ncbi:hypothetical protein D3870_17005 [Noviherbaspirillum cavernae]|uniref:Uncharacterized protein n=1 Tax=Noviherbaspirillum cavernae TaxID=2320862 RepID=A0A418X4X2_9BURK|nr:hypothetical protein D3870_17005 [Noviherbaspirillum cavernae]
MLSGTEWLFGCPGNGIAVFSCSWLRVDGLAWVGLFESPLFGAPEASGLICASDGGIALGGAATDGGAAAEPESAAAGLGGSLAF